MALRTALHGTARLCAGRCARHDRCPTHGTAQDAAQCHAPDPGWQLTDAVAINDTGQILADAASTTNGNTHTLLLTPAG